MRVHLDTDLGDDPDDVCALAMLLGWPDVEIVGVTTTCDMGGVRAGYVRHCLELAGRDDVPVVAGAERCLTGRVVTPLSDPRYWSPGIAPRPAPPGAATSLLRESVQRDAVVVAIGPYTNLGLLERSHPGALADAHVVVMGGWVRPAPSGLPQWGPERDWNVQADTEAARIVLERAGSLTMSTLTASFRAPLRAAHLDAVRAVGPLAALLARQSELHAVDSGKRELGPLHVGLPDDLVNFQYDPLACAVAVGWPAAVVERIGLTAAMEGGVLRLRPAATGRAVELVVDADGAAFGEVWADAVRPASSR